MSSRRIIGITGPPGVGKTTYAVQLAAELCGVHLPMDADGRKRGFGFALPSISTNSSVQSASAHAGSLSLPSMVIGLAAR